MQSLEKNLTILPMAFFYCDQIQKHWLKYQNGQMSRKCIKKGLNMVVWTWIWKKVLNLMSFEPIWESILFIGLKMQRKWTLKWTIKYYFWYIVECVFILPKTNLLPKKVSTFMEVGYFNVGENWGGTLLGKQILTINETSKHIVKRWLFFSFGGGGRGVDYFFGLFSGRRGTNELVAT